MRISDWSSDVCPSDLWPFLLNGLLPRYFPELDRKPEDRLRALLGAGGPHLPTLSGWVADARMLLLLARYTLSRSPRTVVEFGSGVSTLVTAECLRRKGGGSIITHDPDRKSTRLN